MMARIKTRVFHPRPLIEIETNATCFYLLSLERTLIIDPPPKLASVAHLSHLFVLRMTQIGQAHIIIHISLHHGRDYHGASPNSHKHFFPYMGFCASIWGNVRHHCHHHHHHHIQKSKSINTEACLIAH